MPKRRQTALRQWKERSDDPLENVQCCVTTSKVEKEVRAQARLWQHEGKEKEKGKNPKTTEWSISRPKDEYLPTKKYEVKEENEGWRQPICARARRAKCANP